MGRTPERGATRADCVGGFCQAHPRESDGQPGLARVHSQAAVVPPAQLFYGGEGLLDGIRGGQRGISARDSIAKARRKSTRSARGVGSTREGRSFEHRRRRQE